MPREMTRAMINPVDRSIIEKHQCVGVARSILNGLYGGVTRDPGFARDLSDDQVITMCLESGYELRDGEWTCAAINNARDDGATTQEVWG